MAFARVYYSVNGPARLQRASANGTIYRYEGSLGERQHGLG